MAQACRGERTIVVSYGLNTARVSSGFSAPGGVDTGGGIELTCTLSRRFHGEIAYSKTMNVPKRRTGKRR
ncbi:hypothetical protein PoB_007704200 [Plakobranchus ocellatus]|uniref:Uncharacterized protein n=1 Tax=Plakobranchus ocellatus TaxID=259542 RepID=A0AAV4E1Q3_9GAST|nr:hypothetical protein PoB_007704200 [Plakobranchus ocellatus]